MTIMAALFAALVAVTGYMLTQAQGRRERRASEFADALAAVEEYLEAPYRIRRRQAATPEARDALTNTLSDLQARIARHRSWLRVEAPPVVEAYDALIAAARSEAGVQMTEAWKSAPPASDADMNLHVAYQHPNSDAERDKVIAVMRQNLRYLPSIRSLRHGSNAVTGSTPTASQP
jgi:hypothetical protein